MNKPAPTGPARDGSLPPVFALGFRPFYLGAGCFALIAMLLWLASYLGVLAPANAMSGLTWHKHEMLFGFAPAVMAGFLLTAVRSWTGQQTATGVGLAALVLLWVCGRLLVITGPGTVAAVVDSAFLPALGTAIAIPIWRSRNTRNYKVIAIVAALAALNAVFHLSELGILAPLFQEVAFRTALDVVALLIAVIGGRVIPAFTANAVPGAEPVQVRAVEFVAFGSLVMITLVDLSIAWWSPGTAAWVVLLVAGGIGHAVRLALWAPHLTVRNSLLLMLPAAYAWLPVSLLLRAGSMAGMVSPAAAAHALTVGAMSCLMMAMMTRSALGHTGRRLIAGPAEIAAFSLLQVAALLRVLAGTFAAGAYVGTVTLSGGLYAMAFLVFLISYWPKLTRPRIDGKPG